MADILQLKGQHVTCPEGAGDVIETISDKVVVELSNGASWLFHVAQVTVQQGAQPAGFPLKGANREPALQQMGAYH